ncbi:hypothetical protein [Nonomuraea cavernae]|uniref:Core-binding (CB) domain-containing protein n=1 Tax=Nonomuraea cavernae TaxID=2045107 RepID=A0A918DHF9_9ACTN|nr:hypothetical protein [Nonomuraea cavernae]MCA2185559.1 hypothetical protein [Nonomuraea cavernae]GGO66834.1 hypothetical protein GCM10012289_21800 [Nonomuraea cavernae]
MISSSPRRLPPPYGGMLSAYAAALAGSPLKPSSKAKYLSHVSGFLAWTAEAETGGTHDHGPLADMSAAVVTAHDYDRHLRDRGYAPATIANVLAAVDDFYARRGLGATGICRESARNTAAGGRSRVPRRL